MIFIYIYKKEETCVSAWLAESAVRRGEIFKRHRIRIRFPEANYDQTQPFEMVRGYDR